MIRCISNIEKIYAILLYFLYVVKKYFKFRKTFKNYSEVIKKVTKEQFPVEAITANGKFNLKSYRSMYFLSHIKDFPGVEYSFDSDLVIINETKIYGAINNGDIISVFFEGDYRDLPVKDRTVIDIGANIADTAIYFITRKAQRVIGFEPFPRNYEFAKKNIETNNLRNKITIELAACSEKSDGCTTIDPKFESKPNSKLQQFKNGIKVPLITLEEIVSKYNIPRGSVLKVDCEGCENEIFNQTPDSVIQLFDYMMIEYHNGYKLLKKKFEKLGFKVNVSKPRATDLFRALTDKNTEIGYVGFLFAYRQY